MTLRDTQLRGDFAALQAFLARASDLIDRSPAFEAALGALDLNAIVLDVEWVAFPDLAVVVARPAPAWVDLLRKHGGEWP